MARNDFLKFNFQAAALTLNGAVAGTIVGGPSLNMDLVSKGTLSARCDVDAETNTITLAALWEVSDTGLPGSWRRAVNDVNATPVVLATGTAGADASVVRNVSPPDAVYGCKFARCSIQVGVVTGTASDLATVGYDFVDAYNDG